MSEFFSAWHAQAYLDASKREVETMERRVASLGDAQGAEAVKAEAEAAIKAAKGEIKRVEKLVPALVKAEKEKAEESASPEDAKPDEKPDESGLEGH